MSTQEISRTNDYFARYLLGKKENEPLLLSFINSVMRDSNLEEFVAVTVRNPYNLKEHCSESETIVDVKATTSTGEIVLVEIQVKGNKAFFSRVLEYWAKNYRTEKIETDTGVREPKLSPVISINLLAFKLFDSIELTHTSHMIHCCETKTITSKDLILHFIELPKAFYGVQEEELATWLQYFGSDNFDKDKIMIAEKNEIFKKAVGDYEYFKSDSDLISEYEKREIFLNGQYRMLEYERMESRKEGKAEGRQEGRQEGIKQGKLDGLTEVAIKAFKEGFDISTIIKLTGLAEEEVIKIVQE